jgi:hypothetical protein
MKVTKYLLGAVAASMIFASCSSDDDATPDTTSTPGTVQPGEGTPGEGTPGEGTPGEPGEETPVLVVPDTYDASNYNPAAQNVTDQIGAISTLWKKADGEGTVDYVTKEALNAAYTAGSPSVKDYARAEFEQLIITPMFTAAPQISGVAKHSGPYTFTAEGVGIAGDHLLAPGGYEPEQLVEKGTYGGVALYTVAWDLLKDAESGSVTEEQLNDALALYGAKTSFSSEKADVKFTAKYTVKNFVEGEKTYHDAIAYEFRRAQAAIKADNDAEIKAAVAQIISLWDKGIAAQAVVYLEKTVTALSDQLDVSVTPEMDGDDVVGYTFGAGYETAANALHAHSEAVGMVAGLYAAAVPNFEACGTALALMGADFETGSINGLQFVNNTTNIGYLQQAISTLETAYGL